MSVNEVETRAGARRFIVALPVLLFAALAGLFAYAFWDGIEPSTIPSAMIGRPAPEATLPPLDGLMRDGAAVPGLAAGDLKSGKVTVVNVFASWCGPCRIEHPFLELLAETGKARMVGINYKDDPENARRFLGQLGNPYDAVGVDPGGRAAIDWGVYGVPETFVIAPDGTIVHKQVGPIDEAILTGVILPAIEKAAAKPAS